MYFHICHYKKGYKNMLIAKCTYPSLFPLRINYLSRVVGLKRTWIFRAFPTDCQIAFQRGCMSLYSVKCTGVSISSYVCQHWVIIFFIFLAWYLNGTHEGVLRSPASIQTLAAAFNVSRHYFNPMASQVWGKWGYDLNLSLPDPPEMRSRMLKLICICSGCKVVGET